MGEWFNSIIGYKLVYGNHILMLYFKFMNLVKNLLVNGEYDGVGLAMRDG